MLKFTAYIEEQISIGGAGRSTRNEIGSSAERPAEIVGECLAKVVAVVQNWTACTQCARVGGLESDVIVTSGEIGLFTREFTASRPIAYIPTYER